MRVFRRGLPVVLMAAAVLLVLLGTSLLARRPEQSGPRALRRTLQQTEDRWFRASIGPCHHAFIDLGTNIGDVLADLTNIARKDLASEGKRFNPETAEFEPLAEGAKVSKLERLIESWMVKEQVAAPQMCIVGVEGNPVFTEGLQRVEATMRALITPAIDIHTDAVISNVNERTTLFLDTINPDKNFWGSSIASSSINVICGEDAKSKYWSMFKDKPFYEKAEHVDCEKAKADVDAVKLSTLMSTYIDPVAVAQGKSLLIVKMDVEGAEYPVLDELVTSNAACGFTAKGNTFVLIYESHHNSLQGAFADYRGQKYHNNLSVLRNCGIHIFEGERLASAF